MDELLKRTWWVLALQGVVAMLFGVLALIWPGITLLVLAALFAAYALIWGGAAMVGAFQNRGLNDRWWLLLLLGMVSVIAGVVALFNPGLTALALVVVMGVNALFTGVLEIVMAIRLRKAIRGEWLLVLTGLVSMVFGVLVLVFPGAGALAMVWLISVYAIATGALLVMLAFRVRSWRGTGSTPTGVPV